MNGKINKQKKVMILTLKLLKITLMQYQEIQVIPFFILKEQGLRKIMEISKGRLRTLIILLKLIKILKLFFIGQIQNTNMEISKGRS